MPRLTLAVFLCISAPLFVPGLVGCGTTAPASGTTTVVNPGPGQPSPATGTNQTIVKIVANDLAWDPVNQVIYLSLPSADPSIGNAIQIVNPTTGALGQNVFVGSEPNLVAVSASSKYLYVGLDGESEVKRLALPGLSVDGVMALGNTFAGSNTAFDIQPAPNADPTVAVIAGVKLFDSQESTGVQIYDGNTPRPQALNEFYSYDSLQWSSDGTEAFAVNYENSGFDFFTIPVTASGFGVPTDYPEYLNGTGNIHFDSSTGMVYEDTGQIFATSPVSKAGEFAAGGLMVPDGKLNKAFFLGWSQSSPGNEVYTLTTFDLQRMTLISSMTIQGNTGVPSRLIRWGSDGLAFTARTSDYLNGALYIVNGGFVANASDKAATGARGTGKTTDAKGQTP